MENLNFWIMVSFLSPFCYGLINIINGILIVKDFKTPVSLIFYKPLANAVFILPLILLWGLPTCPNGYLLACYFVLGFLDVIYLFPYYRALERIDTSIVGALFSLGRIAIPVMTYLFLDERLNTVQYIGFGVIVLSSVFLSIQNFKMPKINLAFWLMLLSSLILAVFAVLEKFTVDADTNWINLVFYPALFSAIFTLTFLMAAPVRRQIKQALPAFKKTFQLFALSALLSFVALSTMVYVLPYISAVTKASISSTMPMFILGISLVLHHFFGMKFNENITLQSIIKKLILFACIVAGVYMVI